MWREDPGISTGRGADVQMEPDLLLQLKSSPLGLLKDGSFLIIFATERKQVAKINWKAEHNQNLVCHSLR